MSKDYETLAPYGNYGSQSEFDPYKILQQMGSWNKELRMTVSKVRADLSEAESQVIQNADAIIQRVTYEDYTGAQVTSMIVQDAESINLLANKLNLQGLVTLTDLSGDTSTLIHGANIITGTIGADRLNVNSLSAISANIGNINAGNITGVNISGSSITSTSELNTMLLENGKIEWDKYIPAYGSSIASSTGTLSLYASHGITLNGAVRITNSLNLTGVTVTGYNPSVSYASSSGTSNTTYSVQAYNGYGGVELAVNASGDRLYVKLNGSVKGWTTLSP